MLGLLLASAAVTAPQFFGASPVYDPADHRSPSGAVVLHVDPSHPEGFGPCTAELRRDGEVVWSKQLPVTPVRAAVTDRGEVVGYAMTGRSGEDVGEFVVAVLDPVGELVLEHRTPLAASRYLHTPENPFPLGLVVDHARGRFAVRIADEDARPGVESWWRFEIATGARLPDLRPEERLGLPEESRAWITEAHPLPGTPLTLVRAIARNRSGPGWKPTERGQLFALLRDDGRVAWRLDRPREFMLTGDDRAQDELENRVRRHGAVLEVAGDGRFDLWLVADGERARFQAIQRPESENGWTVEEFGREAFAPTDEQDANLDSVAPPEPLALERREPVELAVRSPAGRALLDGVWHWSVESDGHFLAIRSTGPGRFSSLRVSPEGVVLAEQPLEKRADNPLAGDLSWGEPWNGQWLCVRSGSQESDPAWFLVDAASGSIRPQAELELPGDWLDKLDFEAVESSESGGFVAIASIDYEYTSRSVLLRFAVDGSLRWVVHGNLDGEAALLSPEDVTFAADGSVVVLDNIASRLQLYDSSGTHLRNVDLEALCGQEPNYPTRVRAHPDGSLLVHDFLGLPALWQIELDPDAAHALFPKTSDGAGAAVLARNARYAPDGSLWSADGYSLVQLDESGTVVRSLGSPAASDELHEPGSAAVLSDGRLAVQDRRTGALHVWNEQGALLFVGKTTPEDADHVDGVGELTSGPDGSVWVESKEHGFLGWRADGERIGYARFGYGAAFAPDGEHVWTWGYESGVRIRTLSGEEQGTVERRADGTWIRNTADVIFGSDGEALLLDHPRLYSQAEGAWLVRIAKDGEPLSQRRIPPEFKWGTRMHRVGPWTLLSGSGSEVTLVDDRSGSFHSFTVPDEAEDSYWAHGLSPDGERLLCLDRSSNTLHRFGLPK
ncbi:MAG TPA: hypothetical protein VJP77_01800 [Planctomycetota bacterium]|nr:hypothetical protein [Planctomycetota bacterium]